MIWEGAVSGIYQDKCEVHVAAQTFPQFNLLIKQNLVIQRDFWKRVRLEPGELWILHESRIWISSKIGIWKNLYSKFPYNFSDLIHNQITLPPSWSPIFNQVYSEFRSFQSLDWINLQGRLVQIKRIEHGEKIKNLLNNSIRQYGDSLVKKIPNWKSLISSWT